MNVESMLKPGTPHSLGNLRFAGVGIAAHAHGFHVGVLHREDAGSVYCLHLAWHFDLRNEINHGMQAWIALPYPEDRSQAIAAYCRRVWRRQQKNREDGRGVSYAFRYRESRPQIDGDILLGPTECGFTCATFVLLLFRAAAIELVDVAVWPPRSSDAEWHQRMLDLLRKYPPPQVSHEDLEKHLERLKSEVGCARFRPEEVATAASREAYPVHHEDAWRMGAIVASHLRANV